MNVKQPERQRDTDFARACQNVVSKASGEPCALKLGGCNIFSHASTLRYVAGKGKCDCYIGGADTHSGWLHNVAMSERPDYPNHVRAWREFRHLTQDELAEMAGCSRATVGHIESGARRLSDKWAHPIAKALNTSPGYLMDHDPNDLPTAILDVWAAIPEADRPQALRVLESFKRTGTEG